MTKTVAYANRISLTGSVTVNTISSALVIDATRDRTVRSYYDAANRAAINIDALGYATKNEFDALGRVIRTKRYAWSIMDPLNGIAPPDTILADLKVLQSYLLVSESMFGQLARENIFEFDKAGRLIMSQDPMGYVEKYSYNAVGNKLSYTNQKEATWNYEYDKAGRLIKETSPLVNITQLKTNIAGALELDNTNSGQYRIVTLFAYDGLGNLIKRIEAQGRPEQRETQYQYDAMGRQVKTIFPQTGYYDPLADNLTTNGATGSASRIESYRTANSTVSYDAFGHATKNTDASGKSSYKIYDQLGGLKYEIDESGGVTAYMRDTWGNAVTTTRYATAITLTASEAALPVLTATQIENKLTGEALTDRILIKNYDQLGQVIKVIQPSTWIYSSGNRSTVQPGPEYVAQTTITTFNAFGEIIQSAEILEATGEVGITTNYYDQRSQLIASIDSSGYRTDYAYDAAGNRIMSIEYATQGQPGSSALGGNISPLTNTQAISGKDRVRHWRYDFNNRLTQEAMHSLNQFFGLGNTDVRVLKEDLNTFKQSGFSSVVLADKVYLKEYLYDAVGNLIYTRDNESYLNRAIDTTTALQQRANSDRYALEDFKYYDALGRVIAVIRGQGRQPYINGIYPQFPQKVPDYLYNNSGGLLPDDYHLTNFKYDAHGNVNAIIESANTPYEIKNNGTGNYASIVPHASTNVADRITYSVYDRLGNIIQIQDAAGHSHYMSYNEKGLLAKTWQTVTDYQGNKTTHYTVYEYDSSGRRIRSKQAASPTVLTGNSIVLSAAGSVGIDIIDNRYNTFGEVVEKLVNGQQTSYYKYDNAGRIWKTNEGGVDTINLYDLRGNRTFKIASSGQAGGNRDLRLVTQLNAALIAELVSASNVTTAQYKYDNRNNLTRAAAQGQAAALYSYDRWGNILSRNDPRGIVTAQERAVVEYDYDVKNRVVSEQYLNPNGTPGGRLITYEYGTQGFSRTTQDRATPQDSTFTTNYLNNRYREKYEYADRDGRVFLETPYSHSGNTGSSIPGTTLRLFNNFGDIVRLGIVPAGYTGNGAAFTAYQQTQYQHDKMGRVISQSYRLPTIYSIDDLYQITNLGAREVIETFSYDSLGRLITKTDSSGTQTNFRYDANGNTVETQQYGKTARSVFDANNRKTSEMDFNGNIATWTYDALGYLTNSRDFGGTTYTYQYDRAGRLIQKVGSNGQDLRYTYNQNGQQTSLYDAATDKLTEYSYNGLGQRSLEKMTQAGVIYQNMVLEYDHLGNLVKITDTAGGITIRYEYDNFGNRTRVQKNGAENSDRYFFYDAENRLVLANAIDSLGSKDAQSESYYHARAEGDAGITRVTTKKAGTDEACKIESYLYDSQNRLCAIIAWSDGSWALFTGSTITLNTDWRTRITGGTLLETRYDAAGRVIDNYEIVNSPSMAATGQLIAPVAPVAPVAPNLNGPVGAPALTPGIRLMTPATLTYEVNQTSSARVAALNTSTVPAHYAVKSGDTWASITQTVYGTNIVNAATALQTALGNPALTVGARLAVPANLSYLVSQSNNANASALAPAVTTTTTVTVDAYYTVKNSDTWTTITQAVYGTSTATAVAALQTELGNPQLAAGLRLTVPQILSYPAKQGDPINQSSNANSAVLATTETTTTTTPAYYAVISGDTWDKITQSVYGTSTIAAITALQKAILLQQYEQALQKYNQDLASYQSDLADYNEQQAFLARSETQVGNAGQYERHLKRYDSVGNLLSEKVLGVSGDTKYEVLNDSYDQMGNLLTYRVFSTLGDSTTRYYNRSYRAMGTGYQLASITGRLQVNSGVLAGRTGAPGQTFFYYDVNGYLVATTDTTQSERNRALVNNAAGQIIYAQQNGQVQRNLIVDNAVVWREGREIDPNNPVDKNTRLPVFRQIDFLKEQGLGQLSIPQPSHIVTQQNDSLRQVAQRAYGKAELWYLLAEANQLNGDQVLPAGQTLVVPARQSSAFQVTKAYDANQ
ncbi:MAG: RHS repeat protein, partial [Burkholderiales bacterium]|nr:RHS repeat protein [Burkholderiales bacterium]